MIKKASAMEVRQNLGKLLDEVQHRHDSVVITKAGKPVAAIVDVAHFNRMCLLEDEFDRGRKEFHEAFQGESPEAVETWLQKAKHTSRRRQKK